MIKYKISFAGKYQPQSYFEDEAPIRYKVELAGLIGLIAWFSYLGISSFIRDCW
jgi:hypothetical protein